MELLQIATAWFKCAMDSYYKLRQVLQSAMIITRQCDSRPLPTTHDPRHLATCTLNTCPLTRIRSKASQGPRSGIILQWWKLTLS